MKRKSMRYNKLLALACSVVMMFMSFTACGKDDGDSEETSTYETLVASGEVSVEVEISEELSDVEESIVIESSEQTESTDAEETIEVEKGIESALEKIEDDEYIAPDMTEMPKETKKPVKTEMPEEIPVPAHTLAPELTKAPEVVKTPEPIPAPAPTLEPLRTTEPTPQPTMTPTPALEHIHAYVESIWYEPTCSTTGYHNFVCKHCGAVGDGSGDIPMLPHDLVEIVIVEGDCASPRVTEKKCNNCTYVSPRADDYEYHANDHSWAEYTGEVWDDESFSMVPVTEIHCSRCGKLKE